MKDQRQAEKECLNMLAPVTSTIINLSLDTGTFPSLFKQAVVTPLLKKPSLDKESHANYRPISNLSFQSKLTERIVKDCITHHLSTNSMFTSFLSAYTKHHSTETTRYVASVSTPRSRGRPETVRRLASVSDPDASVSAHKASATRPNIKSSKC